MSDPILRDYGFRKRTQWAAGLRHAFDLAPDDSLRPSRFLAARPQRIGKGEDVSAISAANGVTWWRTAHQEQDWHSTSLHQREEGEDEAVFEIDGLVARSVRWVSDRESIWGFDAKRIGRVRRANLHADLEFDAVAAVVAAIEKEVAPLRVVDIAADGCLGIWVLLCGLEDRRMRVRDCLAHFDDEGQCTRTFFVPSAAGKPERLAALNRGKTLAVLAGHGSFLLTLDATDGREKRVLPLSTLEPGWRATQLAADGQDRLALLGAARSGATSSLYLLDADGEPVQDPVMTLPKAATNAIALDRSGVWFATADGAWRVAFETTESTASAATTCNYLTPLLLSPESDAGRGWLRAEIAVDLPAGAVLEATFAGTSDESAASRIVETMRNFTVPAPQRIVRAWNVFEPSSLHQYSFAGPLPSGQPITLPLFQVADRWMLLGFKLSIPPGVTAPPIRELRIFYPNLSIEQNIPAIFRGEVNDPGGVLRRIVGVFEGTTQGLDDRIRAIGASLDPARASSDMLNYVGGWLGLPWHDSLSIEARRRILQTAAALLKGRGTRDGLRQLLSALIGESGRIKIRDLTGDYAVMRLGGRQCRGVALPTLLAGTNRGTATLGGKSVIGRMRLPDDGAETDALDPLASIHPRVRITLTVDSATRRALAPLIDGLLREYLPIAVPWQVLWRVRPVGNGMDGTSVLDADGPGALGNDSEIGRTTLAGSGTARLRDRCLPMGFALS